MIQGIAGTALGAVERAVAQAFNGPEELDPGLREGPLTFGDALKQALIQVEGQHQYATDVMESFVRGEDVELHEVMAAAEEAGIALEMLVEMRNKLVEAYRTIVSMQV